MITMDRELPGFIANRLQEALWREALHMVANGEASVEDIDASITEGPGLRWAFMGPCLTFALAGGEGGMAHMLDHFGPSLKSPWTRLEAPELDRELRDAMVDGCDGRRGRPYVRGSGRRTRPGRHRRPPRHGPAGERPPMTAHPPGGLPVFHQTVQDDWIDYNGHLSEAYYVLIFGFATDALMDAAGLDAAYRDRTGCSLYTVEAHVRYLHEVPAAANSPSAPPCWASTARNCASSTRCSSPRALRPAHRWPPRNCSPCMSTSRPGARHPCPTRAARTSRACSLRRPRGRARASARCSHR